MVWKPSESVVVVKLAVPVASGVSGGNAVLSTVMAMGEGTKVGSSDLALTVKVTSCPRVAGLGAPVMVRLSAQASRLTISTTEMADEKTPWPG